MLDYNYTYLLMGFVFSVFWLALFIWRKDVRKEMLTMSTIGAILGPISDILYTKDYWAPQTITGTTIGIEAVFVGFMIGGIVSVLYEEIFKKRVVPRKKSRKEVIFETELLIFMLGSGIIIFFTSFYFFGINSFYSTLFAFFFFIAVIFYKRKDLIRESIIAGLLFLIVASLVYTVLELLTPGWIEVFWLFENVPSIIIFNLPIDDVFWYFFAGMALGPFYEFWQEERLEELK